MAYEAGLLLILAGLAAAQPPAPGIQPYQPTVPAYNGSLAPQVGVGGSQTVKPRLHSRSAPDLSTKF